MTATDSYLTSAEAIRDLRTLNARFIHNFITNDVASHDALLHPAFIYVRSDGRRVDRTTYLRNWATGFDPDVIIYWDTHDELITVVGPVALVRSTNKETVRQNGTDTTSFSTYTDVYLFQDNAWRCIQAQISPMPDQYAPPDDTMVSVYRRGVMQPKA